MRSQTKKIKLNLGAGFDHRPGFTNLDIDPRTKPDVVHDLSQPLPYESNSVDEILLQDVLEHFTKEDGEVLLAECQRVLKRHGQLTIRVPNVLAIMKKYHHQPDLLFLFLYGDTSQNGVWGAHKYGYTPQTFEALLENFELELETSETEDTNYVFVCRKIKKSARSYQVYDSLWSMLFLTPVRLWQHKRVKWLVRQPMNWLISKLFLKPLSRYVSEIIVSSDEAAEYSQKVLQYSHLKISRLH